MTCVRDGSRRARRLRLRSRQPAAQCAGDARPFMNLHTQSGLHIQLLSLSLILVGFVWISENIQTSRPTIVEKSQRVGFVLPGKLLKRLLAILLGLRCSAARHRIEPFCASA